MIPPVRRVRNGLSSSRLLVAFLVGVGCPAAMAAWSQITWVAALVMVLGTLPILVIESRIWQRLNRRKWERRLPTLLMRFFGQQPDRPRRAARRQQASGTTG